MSGIVFRKPKNRKYVDLNVTSMVDVLFLLLIFFTLTSTFKRAGELELDLPESTTAGASSDPGKEPVQLILTGNGTLLLEGAPTTFDTLLSSLRALRERQLDRRVIIEAEESVWHGQVVRLLDAVRTAGFRGAGIRVRTPEAAPRGRTP